jgi:aspartate/methionine/tyrosine aminotransferase
VSVSTAPFQPFLMERWQSLYEHEVELNLADSAVRCAPLGMLLGARDLEELAGLELFYPQVNGTDLLRGLIAQTYAPAPAPTELLVTVGAAEANALVCSTLLEPGDRVTVIEPGYRQVRGMAENMGCAVDVVQLHDEDAWELDVDELRAKVGPRTKLLAVVNPNNPTGTILSAEARAAILDVVESTGCWLLADEV